MTQIRAIVFEWLAGEDKAITEIYDIQIEGASRNSSIAWAVRYAGYDHLYDYADDMPYDGKYMFTGEWNTWQDYWGEWDSEWIGEVRLLESTSDYQTLNRFLKASKKIGKLKHNLSKVSRELVKTQQALEVALRYIDVFENPEQYSENPYVGPNKRFPVGWKRKGYQDLLEGCHDTLAYTKEELKSKFWRD